MSTKPTPEQLQLAEEEILEALDLYSRINWDRYEANHAGSVDHLGKPLDRNNLRIRVLFMAASLLTPEHGPEAAVYKAHEHLNNTPGFEELVMTLLSVYQTANGGQ